MFGNETSPIGCSVVIVDGIPILRGLAVAAGKNVAVLPE
jgi:hypothetical protein